MTPVQRALLTLSLRDWWRGFVVGLVVGFALGATVVGAFA